MPCFLKIEPETYGWTRVQLCVAFPELESGDLLSGHYGYPVPMEILTSLAQQHKLSIQIPQRGSEKQTDKQKASTAYSIQLIYAHLHAPALKSLHILTMALFTIVMATRTNIYLNECLTIKCIYLCKKKLILDSNVFLKQHISFLLYPSVKL